MKIAIIALKYLEPEYEQTMECLSRTKLPVYYADRDGVGNMSRAFNEAFDKHVRGRYDFVWFVTNIVFEPEVPYGLAALLRDNPDFAAIHPAMNNSDHKHLWQDQVFRNIGNIRQVPFIEFTAPMFRVGTFGEYMLQESTPYYYMDLIISHQIRQDGMMVGVTDERIIGHTYLRNSKSVHPISQIRKQLRDYHTPLSKQYMVDTYGPDWQDFLWPKNYSNG